jgi:hypothetical protein
MRDLPIEPTEPTHGTPSGAHGSAKPVALARALTSCPGVTVRSSIAVLGPAAPAYQLALVEHGFLEVTAASRQGAALLCDRYGCVCVMDDDAEEPFDAGSLAALRRRLTPAGTLLLDVSVGPDRTALAERLRAAHFWMLQYHVLRIQHADGTRRRAVFLVARAPRSPLRQIAAGTERAAVGLGASDRRAA